MRTISHFVVAAAVLGLCPAAFLLARDGDGEAPGRTPAGGLLLQDLIPLSAGGMMQGTPPAVTASAAAAAPTPPILKSWTIKGWAEVSYTWNGNQPENSKNSTSYDPYSSTRAFKENSFRVFDTNHNEFMLNSVALDVAKEATDDSWVGFRVLALVGQDAKWLHAAGLFDQGTGPVSGEGADFDLPDAYISLKVPEKVLPWATTLRIGKWETTHGAEVLMPSANINFSKSYLFGYAIPISHTGVDLSSTILKRPNDSEMVGVELGVVNGWDNVKDNNDSLSYMGQVRFQPCNEFKTSTEVMFGPELDGNNHDWRGLVDIIATVYAWGPLEGLEVTGNYDYGWEDGTSIGYATWYGFAGYLKYKLARIEALKKWYLGLRGEWFDDHDGVRTGLAGGQNFIGLTGTLGFQPWENLLMRFEVRYDKADDEVFNKEKEDFSNHQTTVAVDLVMTF